MEHVKSLNKKAKAIEERYTSKVAPANPSPEGDVRAMQQLPLGCTLHFGPGWEADGQGLVTGLCQPMQADLYGCTDDCAWPAQTPDQLTNFLEWSETDGLAESDWRKLSLIFPEDEPK